MMCHKFSHSSSSSWRSHSCCRSAFTLRPLYCSLPAVLRRIKCPSKFYIRHKRQIVFSPGFWCVRARGTRRPLWSPQSFYLPLFTQAEVLSGVLVRLERCNVPQWEIYRSGNCKLLRSPFWLRSNKNYLCKCKGRGWGEALRGQNQMFS